MSRSVKCKIDLDYQTLKAALQLALIIIWRVDVCVSIAALRLPDRRSVASGVLLTCSLGMVLAQPTARHTEGHQVGVSRVMCRMSRQYVSRTRFRFGGGQIQDTPRYLMRTYIEYTAVSSLSRCCSSPGTVHGPYRPPVYTACRYSSRSNPKASLRTVSTPQPPCSRPTANHCCCLSRESAAICSPVCSPTRAIACTVPSHQRRRAGTPHWSDDPGCIA